MELPLPHPKGYEPEKAQPIPSVGKARPTNMTALLAAQQGGGWPSYRGVARGRPAFRAGSYTANGFAKYFMKYLAPSVLGNISANIS